MAQHAALAPPGHGDYHHPSTNGHTYATYSSEPPSQASTSALAAKPTAQQHTLNPHHPDYYPPQPIASSSTLPRNTQPPPVPQQQQQQHQVFRNAFQGTQQYSSSQAAPFAFHPSQQASAYRSNPPSANPSPQRSPVNPTGATMSSQDWPPSAGPSPGNRSSLAPTALGPGVPSPDYGQQAHHGHDPYTNGRRASDAYLARRTNEVLAMHDHPMARRPSDMGTPSPNEMSAPPPPVKAGDDGRVGVEDPYAERSYTELKVLGDGSFGTVWLCDWHSPVKSGTALSAMQCGAGARPEWAGKRLVALKRMKRVWHGGWREARTLGELTSLRDIPSHPAVIPLLDAFISPRSRELYFVFECMEGNLYQMTKSRKGRPMAAGLIASCFQQIASGLYHIHRHGYFHRDMKPENLLVTTTGLCDYLSNDAVAEINARRDAGEYDAKLPADDPRILKDIQVIVKLADFGLARSITSKPPYTEYVSTRWYRAPEVLLRSNDYGAPVDMWALGTILAEMLNLKPLFPGASEIDQIYRITEVLGDPVNDYGRDQNRDVVGGGQWHAGVKMGKKVGFNFPPRKPVVLKNMFPPDTPRTLVHCIHSMLRYNPKDRITSAQLMDHPYFHEVLPHLQRMVPPPPIPFTQGQPPPEQYLQPPSPVQPMQQQQQQQQILPAEVHHPVQVVQPPHEPVGVFGNGDMRILPPPIDFSAPSSGEPYQRPDVPGTDPWYYTLSPLVYQLRQLDLPTADLASYGQRRWSEELSRRASLASLANSVRPSLAPSTSGYDGSVRGPGSVYEGGSVAMAAEHSNHSLSNMSLNSMSLNRVPSHQSLQRASAYQQQGSNPHVMAFVQQQQQQQQQHSYQNAYGVSQSTPNLTQPRAQVYSQAHPSVNHGNHSTSALPTHSQSIYSGTSGLQPGKKKKWGLSSVFSAGSINKSQVSLSSVDEHGYAGSATSLKRTQSGHNADNRGDSRNLNSGGTAEIVTPPGPSAPVMDSKSAKKDAARRAREAARAKREEAERLQKERSRAVLNKRTEIVDTDDVSAGIGEIEYVEEKGEGRGRGSVSGHPYGGVYGSQQSIGSQRSYGHSAYGSAFDVNTQSGRNKARKKAEDDDHSSIGRASGAASRSLLSVASFNTIDSDPGPRRVSEIWPQQGSHGSRRTSAYRPANMSASNVSLESQLASQLARQATVASASESSLSLGHSSRAAVVSSDYRTEPGSPHGHPAYSGRVRRHASRAVLPSIGDWEGPNVPVPPQPTHEAQHEAQQINPMFRVPTQEQNTTLPPFSAIASMANSPQQTTHPNHLHSIPRPHH